jgi:hypothetical protein
MQINMRGRMPTWIRTSRPPRLITSFSKTHNNETGRSLLGRSCSSFRIGTARPTSGDSDLSRRFQSDTRLEIDHSCPSSNVRSASWPWAFSRIADSRCGRSRQGECRALSSSDYMDRSKLTQRIGELNLAELRQVEDGIKAAMDLR